MFEDVESDLKANNLGRRSFDHLELVFYMLIIVEALSFNSFGVNSPSRLCHGKE